MATRVNERGQPPENRSLVHELSFNVDEQIRVLFTRISNAVYAHTCFSDDLMNKINVYISICIGVFTMKLFCVWKGSKMILLH